MSRWLLPLVLLAPGCDDECEAVGSAVEPAEPGEPVSTIVTVLAGDQAECGRVGWAAWQAVGFWSAHGVPWSFGGCTLAADYPREVTVDVAAGGAITDGLVPEHPGVTLYAVDRIEYTDDDGGTVPHRGFVARLDAAECAVIGAIRSDRAEGLAGLVAHELGHVAGLGHSGDPADVMHPTPGEAVPEHDADVARFWTAERTRVCG